MKRVVHCVAQGLLLVLCLCLIISQVQAADPPPLANDYTPFAGEPFFLLSDASFASNEAAQVRLEVTAPQQLMATGGVDIVVYRVPEPLAFLQKQRNLHRIDVAAVSAPEGLANTLTHVWDNWVVKSRLAWQKLFSAEARKAVTAQAPALKSPKDLTRPSSFEEPRQFKPLPGFKPVQRFRYPVPFAQSIKPPKGVQLEGSSSEFVKPGEGNVFVPLGPMPAGLYLVEAMSGQYRAHTLLFISDTMVVSKTSGAQMLVWSAHRNTGQAVPAAKVVWTDGVGVLQSGSTDAQGLLRLNRKSPETSYVFGQDAAGGVFISENFYYDSEIYNAKVYATTDRPLYRPGDAVKLKVTGREFKSARESVALADGEIGLQVNDPAGLVVATQTLKFTGSSGAQGEFFLPDNAVAGGYELMLSLRGERYTAAFRVADYQKPHFELTWSPDKADFRTGEAVTGKLQLNYPDGKPVANARISLSARAQRLSMVEGELDYSGAFALKLAQDELNTDSSGGAKFSLPAAEQPSRYTLTALATDGAAYRVRSTRELLVERGSASFQLIAEQQFSKPGERMNFRVAPSQRNTTPDATAQAVTWEWLRLEDRSKETGKFDGKVLALSFARPGSYTLSLRDAQQRVVAAASHFVSGDGQKAPVGSIGIVFDRVRYQPGDTATALVTFPQAVTQALVTLERDQVDAAVLLTKGGEGVSSERLSDTQWKLRLKVTEQMAPNISLSVALVQGGNSVFQNQGLVVQQPKIALAFKADKEVYAPGDMVNIELRTTVAGQAVASEVTVGVVDELIYVLQPEIAPRIDDFFYHPRRNNVRTGVSFNFIGYDLATRKLGEVPARRQVNERATKVLERPRRDDVDTAAWLPNLRTNNEGVVRFSFRMPESLTRWRLTGRAMDGVGRVGQQTAWVRSDKDFYLKWASPNWQREGDQAQASLAVFNQTRETQQVQWSAKIAGATGGAGASLEQSESLSLKPGINFISLPLKATALGATDFALTLSHKGQVVDRLNTSLQRLPVAWRAPQEAMLNLTAGAAKLDLPADATRVRVSLASDAAAAAFSRGLDSLVDYPFGCVEQTASRMLPLALALQSLSAAQQPLAPMLTQRLAGARLSLAQMAGPQATFGWWGRGMADDAFLTAYAYYADWRATQALRTSLPEAHWLRVLDVYAKSGSKQPALQRALALHWMQELGLTVAAMQGALLDELVPTPADATQVAAAASASASDSAASPAVKPAAQSANPRNSWVMADSAISSNTARDMALVLTAHGVGNRANAAHKAAAEAASARLADVNAPLPQALLLLTQKGSADKARALLAQVRGEQATLDRAQSLLWIHKALGGRPELRVEADALAAPWLAARSSTGDALWQWPTNAALPKTLALAANSKAQWAYMAYESRESGVAPALPVRIERQLFKVVALVKPKPPEAAASAASGARGTNKSKQAATKPPDDGRLLVKLELVKPGTALDSNALYLDQLNIQSEGPLRWALLEAALPPGASVESGTWGLDLPGTEPGQTKALERATHQSTAHGYAVPVDTLAAQGTLTVRHLIRFAQRGQFKLPPSRLYRMYEPDAKAVDRSGQWATMEVK